MKTLVVAIALLGLTPNFDLAKKSTIKSTVYTTYKIVTKTGNGKYSKTDDRVWIVVYGENGTIKIPLNNEGNDREPNQTDTYKHVGIDVGQIKYVELNIYGLERKGLFGWGGRVINNWEIDQFSISRFQSKVYKFDKNVWVGDDGKSSMKRYFCSQSYSQYKVEQAKFKAEEARRRAAEERRKAHEARRRAAEQERNKPCSFYTSGTIESNATWRANLLVIQRERKSGALKYCRNLGGVNWDQTRLIQRDGYNGGGIANGHYVYYEDNVYCNCNK